MSIMKEEIKSLIEKKRDAHRNEKNNSHTEWSEAYHQGASDTLHQLLVQISDMEEE